METGDKIVQTHFKIPSLESIDPDIAVRMILCTLNEEIAQANNNIDLFTSELFGLPIPKFIDPEMHYDYYDNIYSLEVTIKMPGVEDTKLYINTTSYAGSGRHFIKYNLNKGNTFNSSTYLPIGKVVDLQDISMKTSGYGEIEIRNQYLYDSKIFIGFCKVLFYDYFGKILKNIDGSKRFLDNLVFSTGQTMDLLRSFHNELSTYKRIRAYE